MPTVFHFDLTGTVDPQTSGSLQYKHFFDRFRVKVTSITVILEQKFEYLLHTMILTKVRLVP